MINYHFRQETRIDGHNFHVSLCNRYTKQRGLELPRYFTVEKNIKCVS